MALRRPGLDALQAGAPQAVVDELSRQMKAGLSDDRRLYPQIESDCVAMNASTGRGEMYGTLGSGRRIEPRTG
ncbi:hypothetical protein PV392_17070 [Streptomyces sp. ME03-5709C]|nr:hypothetical protein [Streptomyces sp. ME03-5709C]